MQDFLRQKAISFEKSHLARTYLIIDNESVNILGYFSLSFKEVSFENCPLSKEKIKKVDGRNKNATKAKAFLIGQIAKNFLDSKNPINLQFIIDESLNLIYKAQEIIGGRIVILECENNQRLIQHYENHGFAKLNVDPDPEKLVTMYLFIA